MILGPDQDCSVCGNYKVRPGLSMSVVCATCDRYESRLSELTDALDVATRRAQAAESENERLWFQSNALDKVAHALGVCVESEGHACTPGTKEDLLKRVKELTNIEREHCEEVFPKRLVDWHEDDGNVLWWKFPIVEPPYCGTPLDDDFPDYVTHWTHFRCALDPLP